MRRGLEPARLRAARARDVRAGRAGSRRPAPYHHAGRRGMALPALWGLRARGAGRARAGRARPHRPARPRAAGRHGPAALRRRAVAAGAGPGPAGRRRAALRERADLAAGAVRADPAGRQAPGRRAEHRPAAQPDGRAHPEPARRQPQHADLGGSRAVRVRRDPGRRGRRAVVAAAVGRVPGRDRDGGVPAAGGVRADREGHLGAPDSVRGQPGPGRLPRGLQAALRGPGRRGRARAGAGEHFAARGGGRPRERPDWMLPCTSLPRRTTRCGRSPSSPRRAGRGT